MTTATFKFVQISQSYQIPLKPAPELVQRAARIWFNRRKLRQHARQAMDFMNLPKYVTLKYKLR